MERKTRESKERQGRRGKAWSLVAHGEVVKRNRGESEEEGRKKKEKKRRG